MVWIFQSSFVWVEVGGLGGDGWWDSHEDFRSGCRVEVCVWGGRGTEIKRVLMVMMMMKARGHARIKASG